MEADVGGQHAAVLPAQRPDPQQAIVTTRREEEAVRCERRNWSHGTQVGGCLQVSYDAALVPQQAAVTQFDGGNQLSSTIGFRLIADINKNTTK